MNQLSNQDYYKAFLRWWTVNFPFQEYDKAVDELNRLDISADQKRGWLRAARESLMVSTEQASEKLNMSKAGYSKLEKMEDEGHITIETLAKAAEALDCELVYAVRPKKRVRFSQLIWQKLVIEAQVHSWVRRSSPQTKPQALAKIATELFRDPEFRKRQGWKRRSPL
jgi:transcriptional regulator with XRE-family HTH domain